MRIFSWVLATLFMPSAFAATLEVTITPEGISPEKINDIGVTFRSTNPLCKVLGSAIPLPTDRVESKKGSARVVDGKVVVTANTAFPGSNFCDFKLTTVSVSFGGGLTWVALSSTASENLYQRDEELLEIITQPHREFVVSCAERKCTASADGQEQSAYRSNMGTLYLDAKELKKAGTIRGAFKLILAP